MAAVEPEAAFGPADPGEEDRERDRDRDDRGEPGGAADQRADDQRQAAGDGEPGCATSLSRLVPPKPAMTSVAKPPNVANSAICGSPIDLVGQREQRRDDHGGPHGTKGCGDRPDRFPPGLRHSSASYGPAARGGYPVNSLVTGPAAR